jgi:uncharacterized protein
VFWLIPAFLITALLYASVGFGGGSTYSALLALSGIDYRILPAISLVCNIIVVTGGTIRFARAGLLDWRRALPLALVAAPFAWAGGLTPIKETTFLTLLAVSLAAAGVALLVQRKQPAPQSLVTMSSSKRSLTLAVSVGLGYLAGLVGIGGGIFLAPFLHLIRWGKAQAIAATASLFILINSVAGLIGQGIKLSSNGQFPALASHWPLGLSVLIGGQIGSMLGIKLFSPDALRRLTGVLVLYVAGQLAWKLLHG